MSILSKRQRRPDHAATSHGGRRRRGGAAGAGRLFDSRAAWASPESLRSQRPATPEQKRRLEEVLLTTWAALNAGHPVECPVCGGPLTASEGCRSCGSRLT